VPFASFVHTGLVLAVAYRAGGRWRVKPQTSAGGRNAALNKPKLMSCCNHWQSNTSDLRPDTCLTLRRIDQHDFNSVGFQNFVHGNPIHAGRFERDYRDPACQQPSGHLIQILRIATEFPNCRCRPISRYGHKVATTTDINAGGIGGAG